LLQAALTTNPGVLTVGVVPELPPLLFLENGEYTGLEADYARLIAHELKLEIKFIPFQKEKLLEALESKQVDLVMNGIKVTPTLSHRVHLLPTYLHSSQMAIILYDNILKLSGPGQLYRADKTIGVITSTSGEKLVEKEISDGVVKKYPSIIQGFKALRSSEIQYLIHDAPTSWHLARDLQSKDLQSLYKPLNKEELTFALKKGNHLLIQKIERLFRDWKTHGVIEMMNRRWIKARMEVN